MSKLAEYLKTGIFPIVRTGLSNDDWEIQTWKRISNNIHYNCNLCDCEIKPDDFLNTHTQRGYSVPRDSMVGIRNKSEVLGFICKTCTDEISDYDNLYYG